MASVRTWFRQIGAIPIALMLCLMTLAPSFDGLICQNEAVPAVAEVGAAAPVASADHGGPGHAGDGDVCIHGHCHHAAVYVPVALVATSEPVFQEGRRLIIRTAVATSDRHFMLERPPRV